MNPYLRTLLGILTAMGGFVEIGALTFSVNAGARFGSSLLWVVALATLGIILYTEMAGRVAAVTRQPVFDWVRERAGFRVGLGTLIAANLVSLLTCAAEIGGVAIVLRLLTGWPYRLLAVLAFLVLLVAAWSFAYRRMKRVFGLLGLLMCVFVVAALKLHPDWRALGASLLPNVPPLESPRALLVYAFLAVSLMSSILLPHETYVCASGAIEDGWRPHEVPTNRIVVAVGFVLGSTVSAALLLGGARLLSPAGIEAVGPGTAALVPAFAVGRAGLALALLGMLFAFGGAAVENALSGAYNTAQFLGWRWGKWRKPSGAPRFTLAWMGILAAATVLVLAGVNPVELVKVSIALSILILPLIYLPLLMAAGDARLMGPHANNRITTIAGWFYLALVTLAGLVALPLYLITRGGRI